MVKVVFLFSSLSGILAVGLGAFGAHALKAKLENNGLLATYQTAVQYQFYHTLALLVVGLLLIKYTNQWLTYSGYFMMAGILIFSGSLYVLSLSGIKWFGAITPIGGLALILGWTSLFLSFTQIKF